MKDKINEYPLHIFDKDDGQDFQSKLAAIILASVFAAHYLLFLLIIIKIAFKP